MDTNIPAKSQKTPSIKKNFIMNTILNMSGFIFPLISYPYVSRILGPDGIGSVNFAISFVTYFNMFAQLGIPSYGIRACARVRDDKEELGRTVTELLIINLITSAIVYIIFFAVIFSVPSLRADKSLYIIISATIILNSLGMSWLFQALEKYSYITIRSVIFKFIAVAGMFLLVKSQDDYLIYAALTIFAASASNILNLIYSQKLVRIGRSGRVIDPKRHLKPVFVFFAMACATTVYLHLDNVMLGIISSKTEVGYYSTSVKIKSILVVLVTSLGSVLLPRLSYYVENKMMEEFRRISAKALHFVLIISIPLVVYFFMYAAPVIQLIAGEKFTASVLPMQIIMPTLLFIGITNIYGIQILVPYGLEKYVLYSEIGGAVADLILNAILIPFYGAAGAAFGTLVAEAVVLIIQYRKLKSLSMLPSSGVKLHVIILATVVSGVLSLLSYIPDFSRYMSLTAGSFLVMVISCILFFIPYFCLLLVFKDSFVTEMVSKYIRK